MTPKLRTGFWAAALLLTALPAMAQPAPQTHGPIALTVDEAVAIAVERNYAIRTATLETANAAAQVREAWGQVMPSVNATSSYTRNVVTANPFAGSEAGGLFGALAALDWLAYNEQARTDGDPSTEPISLDEFRRRQADGYADAGLTLDPGRNPFGVPNQFVAGVSITQTIYSGSAFAAIRGAQSFRDINQAALVQEQHRVIHEIRQQFYAALLADRQEEVARAAVERARATHGETARLVAAGTLPVLERLSAEVEVTNLETQLVQSENNAATARSNLLFSLGLPVSVPIRLAGTLDVGAAEFLDVVAATDAFASALERRPEIVQARLAVELQEVNRDITVAQSRPVVSAFANLNYYGNVPDDRRVVIQGRDPNDPFAVAVESRGFFNSGYWNPSVAVGAQMTWNIFDGFQTRYRRQQHEIAIEQARITLEQAEQAVALEVDIALRSMASARQRMAAQRDNVTRAETAYQFASTRLTTGVSSQIDVRMASGQLDQAHLGYLQAVYDYLVARSELQRATGVLLPDDPRADHPILTTSAH